MITNVASIAKLFNASSSEPSSIQDALQERFAAIFPNVWIMLATLIALVLVVLILWKLTHKPIRKAIKARQDYIQDNIDKAKENNELSQEKLARANQRLTIAEKEANNIVREAQVTAEKVVTARTAEAQAQAQNIIAEAKLDIKQQREELKNNSKNQVAKAAVELSRKILKREISEKSEKDIIQSFLESDVEVIKD